MGSGMGVRKGVDLLRKAVKDFELAKKYRDAKEYVTASMLYRNATEKVLKSLVMQKSKREPPKNASIEYLASKANIPESIYGDLVEMPDERSELMEEESLLEMEFEEKKEESVEAIEYHNAISKHDVVKRLIDYAKASANV